MKDMLSLIILIAVIVFLSIKYVDKEILSIDKRVQVLESIHNIPPE